MAELEPFGQVVTDWRVRRRLTKQALAEAMGFDRSYISHVEAGRHHPSADFARKAEAALNAGGEVWKAWMDSAHSPGEAGNQARPVTARSAAGLVVEIVERGDPILTGVATPFDLPGQAAEVRALIDELLAAMARVREHHVFGKGMGLAAPQIGVGRAAAIVQPPGDDATPIVLLNPVVVSESTDTDTQYEGCLSFFDVRGQVPRPLRLEVEHSTPAAEHSVTVFSDGMARLVAHEIDHLNGRTYLDRMSPGTEPISVEEYKGTAQAWRYGR